MTQWAFEVPHDLRSFFAEVVEALDRLPEGERAQAFRAEDSLQSGCGYGGREPGGGRLRFVYFPERRGERWVLLLEEREVRAFAGGAKKLLTPRIEKADRRAQRWPSGEGLLVWGGTSREAMAAGNLEELARALEALRSQATSAPQVFRLWSRMDDLMRAVVCRDRCALEVAFQDGTCVRSEGGSGGCDDLGARDVDGWTYRVAWDRCLPWTQVVPVLPVFVHKGEVEPLQMVEATDRRLQQQASLGRRGVLHGLGPVPRGLEDTSLAVAAPGWEAPALREGTEDHAWARRVLDWMDAYGLVELEDEAVAARGLASLLRNRGDEAMASLEEAEELLDQTAELEGVTEVFATVDQLRRAMKETVGR